MSDYNKNNDSTDNARPAQPGLPSRRGLGFRQMVGTILFGALGVQSSKARERDFGQGKASHFIFFGVGFMLIFTLVIIGVVKLVLHFAGR